MKEELNSFTQLDPNVQIAIIIAAAACFIALIWGMTRS